MPGWLTVGCSAWGQAKAKKTHFDAFVKFFELKKRFARGAHAQAAVPALSDMSKDDSFRMQTILAVIMCRRERLQLLAKKGVSYAQKPTNTFFIHGTLACEHSE